MFAWSLLFYWLGISLLGSIIVGAFILGTNYYLALWNIKLQQKVLDQKDMRMKYTAESINNIKNLKLNTLCEYFMKKIFSTRVNEIKQIKLKAINDSIEFFL